jgi:hypothetical protein
VTIPNSALQVAGTYSVEMQDITSGNPAYPPLTFMVLPATLNVSSITPPDGQVGAVYPTQTINVSGGTAPYTATPTGLPAGLSLTANANGSVLTIAGTPTTTQTAASFSISVKDSSSPAQTKTATR